jgi:hypothetical protein
MGQDVEYVDDACIVVYSGDKAVMVSYYVKDGYGAVTFSGYLVSMWEGLA